MGIAFVDSHQKSEGGLSQSSKYVWSNRHCSAFLLAICFSLSASLAFGQESSPTPSSVRPTSVKPNASTPIQIPAATSGNDEQARLARQQGQADSAVLDWVLANSGPIKGDTRAGELRVAFTMTPAEGWWDRADAAKLAWHDAPDDNVHLRIFILDLADGRLVPGLTVHATLTDANGNQQSVPADFGWYPLINAYGGNLPLDADSTYTLRVDIDPLSSAHTSGNRFEHATVAEFSPVPIAQEAVSQLPLATATAWDNEPALLKPSNAALSAAITALWTQSASGAEQAAGDYFVGYALDYSGAAVHLAGSKLRIQSLLDLTGKDNVRLEILARDSRTGRLIPSLKPEASLIAPDGKSYGPGELPMVWNASFNDYQRNARIPNKDAYKLRVHFEVTGIRRWGRQNERFALPADVEFENVSLKDVSSKGQPSKDQPANGVTPDVTLKDQPSPQDLKD
jgi:hypothetical protein